MVLGFAGDGRMGGVGKGMGTSFSFNYPYPLIPIFHVGPNLFLFAHEISPLGGWSGKLGDKTGFREEERRHSTQT